MLRDISIWQLLILLAIVVMIFGTKRLRGMGSDLGSALKDFRSAMKKNDDERDGDSAPADGKAGTGESRVIDQSPEDVAHHSDGAASHDRRS